ncbi:MAG: carbon-nitrogen hydrolase family protein [Thermoleophilaceae bacterium]|nr:carbon-nitrogen hydrolase family protein [Thermoleophilaceae bacterium]
MRAAAVQLNSTDDKDRNLARADRLTREAAADGAGLIVLPEKFNLLGTHDHYEAGAEPLDGPTVRWARETARELKVDLVAGSFVERREGHDKLGNTSVHVGPDGEVRGVYRKIHMFDVTVAGKSYRESTSQEAGDEVVTSEAEEARLGLTVCYDLRFPELYRILAIRGARILIVPAAFTKTTGQAHWDTLLRARAIENQAFVIAADQIGVHPPGNESFGGSQIVDPWGEVLARAADQECVVTADLDFARQDEVRESLPSLANRVPSAYRWPEEVGV